FSYATPFKKRPHENEHGNSDEHRIGRDAGVHPHHQVVKLDRCEYVENDAEKAENHRDTAHHDPDGQPSEDECDDRDEHQQRKVVDGPDHDRASCAFVFAFGSPGPPSMISRLRASTDSTDMKNNTNPNTKTVLMMYRAGRPCGDMEPSFCTKERQTRS